MRWAEGYITTAEFYGAFIVSAFIASNLYVPVSNCHAEKSRVFQFGRISLNISLRDSVLKKTERTKKHRA